jgi:hypothetical protein
MTDDGFEATFRIRVARSAAWTRLVGGRDDIDPGTHLWLPGFDSQATVVSAEATSELRATKDEEPCLGTDIVVTLEDDESGARIRVVQSRFGDWLAPHREVMAVGWQHIVADLQAFLATGVHARRHLRGWGDLGADTDAVDGGVRLGAVRSDGLAGRLGLIDGDLLTTLAGAPVTTLAELATVLRVIAADPRPTAAEWIRDGELVGAGPVPVS